MPAYDFRCTVCDTTFEIVRKFSDSSDVLCPECGGQTKRVFTPVGVHFKGSGFYNTDSRRVPATPATNGVAEKKEPATAAGSCPSSGGESACAGCPAAE
ncbi:MAG: FmdB family transcriptional regulator [Coriobacteriia bacterium]|nr:FmdB family transcriptional regulator [Coriobacteriia bacterium]MBN2822731.1 FmdB family transcriptional regulator [Coriobacteriia bacterium]